MIHIFSATKILVETRPQLMKTLTETLDYIYDVNWFPGSSVAIRDVASEVKQKLQIDHKNIEIQNHKAGSQPFICTYVRRNTNTSLETSPIDNLDTILYSQPKNSNINEATETDFNSTLLVDGTLFGHQL